MHVHFETTPKLTRRHISMYLGALESLYETYGHK